MERAGESDAGWWYILNNNEIETVTKSNLMLLNHLSIPTTLRTLSWPKFSYEWIPWFSVLDSSLRI